MSIWLAVVLGLTQGFTEFLPISSTAHLKIVPTLLGQADPGVAFSAVIQLGTLLAVLAYFARDVFIDLPQALFKRDSPQRRVPFLLIIGTIPVVVGGVALKKYIGDDFRQLWVIATALASVGAIMLWVDRRGLNGTNVSSAGNRQTPGPLQKTMNDLSYIDAGLIGLAQACALIPGVSRSGATMCAALVIGMMRPEAARFSFLLSIPAIGGAGVFELKEIAQGANADTWIPLAVGTAVAAVSGYLSIAWLLRYLSKHTFTVFAAYRIALAGVLFALWFSGTR